jgi:hypothetical protein
VFASMEKISILSSSKLKGLIKASFSSFVTFSSWSQQSGSKLKSGFLRDQTGFYNSLLHD